MLHRSFAALSPGVDRLFTGWQQSRGGGWLVSTSVPATFDRKLPTDRRFVSYNTSAMKIDQHLEHYRVITGPLRSAPGEPFGAFLEVPGPCGEKLAIMVDNGETSGWEHVSVSTRRRIPNWIEMAWVKDRCWDEEDCVVQFHPAKSRYVNNYNVVLHMWRRIGETFPTPPDILVGFKGLGELA